MDKSTIATASGAAVLTVAALVALYWPGGDVPAVHDVERLQPDQLAIQTLNAERVGGVQVADGGLSSSGIGGDRVGGGRSARSLWEPTPVTPAVEPVVRSLLPAPAFYTAIGEIEATSSIERLRPYLQPNRRYVIYFSSLGADWRAQFADVWRLAADSVCVLDFAPGTVNGPAIEDFVRATHASEVVFGWHLSNVATYTNEALYAGMAADMATCVEYAKRGNPEVFTWVCAVYGYETSGAWAEAVNGVPFDGVALWGPHTLPSGWKARWLAKPLKWAQARFEGRPVAYASLYVVYKAYNIEEGVIADLVRARVAKEAHRAVEVCKQLGYAAVWRQVGSIPDHIFKGLEP